MLKNSNVEPFNRTSLKVLRKLLTFIQFYLLETRCFFFVFICCSFSFFFFFFFRLSLEYYGLSISIWRVDVIMRHPSKTFIHCELRLKRVFSLRKRRITCGIEKKESARWHLMCVWRVKCWRMKKMNIAQQQTMVVCQTKRATLKPYTEQCIQSKCRLSAEWKKLTSVCERENVYTFRFRIETVTTTEAAAAAAAVELMMEKTKWKLVQTVVEILSRSLLCVNYLASSMGFLYVKLLTFLLVGFEWFDCCVRFWASGSRPLFVLFCFVLFFFSFIFGRKYFDRFAIVCVCVCLIFTWSGLHKSVTIVHKIHEE